MNKKQLDAITQALQIMQADYAKMVSGNTTAYEEEILLPLRWQHIQAAFHALAELRVELTPNSFPVIYLSREDLGMKFGEKFAARLTDDEMTYLADKICDDLMDAFWESVEQVTPLRFEVEEDEDVLD